MGAGASELAGTGEAAASGSGLGEMPELCAAEVLLRLGATDICRLARLNRAFRGAAAADFVWEAKLPENYGYLMGFVHGGKEEQDEEESRGMKGRGRVPMGKKEVYARLAKAVPFDDGKRVSLLSFLAGIRICSSFILTKCMFFQLLIPISKLRHRR